MNERGHDQRDAVVRSFPSDRQITFHTAQMLAQGSIVDRTPFDEGYQFVCDDLKMKLS